MQESFLEIKQIKKLPLDISIVLLCIIFFMTACSMRIMYNRLDWIIPIYLDEYVSLSDQQENFFDPMINRFLEWHRSKELPRYMHYVDSLREAQTESMSREQVLVFFDEAEGLWKVTLQQAMPSLFELAAALNDTQILEINDALRNKIRKLKKKYGSKNQTDRRAVAANKMTDTMQDLVGELTEEQAELIRLWSRTKKDTTDDWLSFRDNWRRQFIELLNHRQDVHSYDELRLFLLQPEKIYNTAHRQAVRENRQYLAQLIAELSATLIPDQRAHLQQKLSEIIYDLQALHN